MDRSEGVSKVGGRGKGETEKIDEILRLTFPNEWERGGV
jgi:hypothetical protein